MLKIIEKKLQDIKPYEKNPRKNNEAVKYVAESIRQFGFKVPIVIDVNNVIVCGHTRYKACKELGLEKVPCVVADDLTDEQIRAYRLADNKVSEQSQWDLDLLGGELADILDIDMSDFGFDIPDVEEEEEEEKHNEAERTGNAYNLSEYDEYNTAGYYQMPVLEPCNYIPDDIIGFNYALTSKNKDCGIHFYIDDYQFERIWTQPQLYLEKLSEYQCIFTPDFSLYTDMPIAMKIWNIYRSRLIGQIIGRISRLDEQLTAFGLLPQVIIAQLFDGGGRIVARFECGAHDSRGSTGQLSVDRPDLRDLSVYLLLAQLEIVFPFLPFALHLAHDGG